MFTDHSEAGVGVEQDLRGWHAQLQTEAVLKENQEEACGRRHAESGRHTDIQTMVSDKLFRFLLTQQEGQYFLTSCLSTDGGHDWLAVLGNSNTGSATFRGGPVVVSDRRLAIDSVAHNLGRAMVFPTVVLLDDFAHDDFCPNIRKNRFKVHIWIKGDFSEVICCSSHTKN